MEILAFLSADASGRHRVVIGMRAIVLKLAHSVKLKESTVMSPTVPWAFHGAKAAIHLRVGFRVKCSRRVFKNNNTTIKSQYG